MCQIGFVFSVKKLLLHHTEYCIMGGRNNTLEPRPTHPIGVNIMSKSRRDRMKEQLAQGYNHLDIAMERLMGLKLLFDPHHPELAEGLEIANVLILQAQQTVLQFADNAWGMNEDSIIAYTRKNERKQ